MPAYKCPVCQKPLSKTEYFRALDIINAPKKRIAQLERRVHDLQTHARKARKQGEDAERARSQRLFHGYERKIGTLKERIRQLEKGTTPQTDGLDEEPKLVARLKREFPEDEVLRKGRDGDVLHHVRLNGKTVGTIIYECKRTQRLQTKHVEQAHRAKQHHTAHFAVLVTTGHRRGFAGFASINGIFVVQPLGAVALASLLRVHLIAMARAAITKEQSHRIALKLVDFITSPRFKNRMDEIVQAASHLEEMVADEMDAHQRMWEKRRKQYERIRWDGQDVLENVHLVLSGKEPLDGRGKVRVRGQRVPAVLPRRTQAALARARR